MMQDDYSVLLTGILNTLRSIEQTLRGESVPRDPWTWPDRIQMEKYGVPKTGTEATLIHEGPLTLHDEPRQGTFTASPVLIHRVCPVFEDCEGYETQRHDAVGAFVIHLRERHGEWYEKFARQAAHDNETD